MSPLEIIIVWTTAATMLSAQVMTETIVQTKKPRCISVLRPIPQPEPQQLPPRVSRLPSPPSSKSSPTSGAKPPITSAPKSLSSAGPKSPSPSSKFPKAPTSTGPKSPSPSSKFPKALTSTGPKSPYSGSDSLSAGSKSLSSTGAKPQSSGSKSPSSRRKPPSSAGPPSNPSEPPAFARTSPDSFSLLKLPFQLISNVLMPPTIKRNKSSVVAPLINIQMPLTFTTVHGAPNRVPCKPITDPSMPVTCTDITAGNPPPAVPVRPSFGAVLYDFLCNVLFHTTIDLPPKNTACESTTTTTTSTTTTTTTTTTSTGTTDSTTPATTIPVGYTTSVATPTADGPTDTTVVTDKTPLTTTAEPKITTPGTAVSTQTPADRVICKFASCLSPVLRHVISKHAVCKSSLPSTCRINGPVNNKQHFHRRPDKCHAPKPSSHYGDTFNHRFATESYANPVAPDNAQEELLLKLLEILISSSNRPPPVFTST